MKVYLCGPITGCSYEGATDWRNIASKVLKEGGFEVLDPMRGKSFLSREQSIKDCYEESYISNTHTIYQRDKFDVSNTDIILAFLVGAKTASIGSCFELAWGAMLGKFIVTVQGKDDTHNHAFVREATGVRMDDLGKALRFIREMFGGK